jgi:hypothetical protein
LAEELDVFSVLIFLAQLTNSVRVQVQTQAQAQVKVEVHVESESESESHLGEAATNHPNHGNMQTDSLWFERV